MRTDRRGRPVLDAHTLPPRYAGMLAHLNANVFGQSHAFPPILRCIQRYESGLGDPNRPVGCGFLGGATGTGKTLTAEEIAVALHHEPKFITINCGELQEKSALTSFVGAPPSYVGHGETVPLLTQEFLDQHKSPHSDIVVLLLDEFEKAHPDFQRLLLGVEEKGVLNVWVPDAPQEGKPKAKSATHTPVKMTNVLILKTTNAGAERLSPALHTRPSIGFVNTAASEAKVEINGDTLRDELRGYFSPEFLNRQDFFVAYKPLERSFIPHIRKREISKIEKRIGNLVEGVSVRLTADAKSWVDARGFDPLYGARPLRRLVENELVTPLSNLLSQHLIKPHELLIAQPSDDGARLDFVPARLTRARAGERLSDLVDDDATRKQTTEERVERLASGVIDVVNDLPQTSAVAEALRVALERADDATKLAEKADVLRRSIEHAIGLCGKQASFEPAPKPILSLPKKSGA